MTTRADSHPPSCPRCGDTLSAGDVYVLLPAADVPRTGSRTEIVVTPGDCLRVVARACAQGHVLFDLATPNDERR